MKNTESLSEAQEATAREAVHSMAFFTLGAKGDSSASSKLTATHTGSSTGMEELANNFKSGTKQSAGTSSLQFVENKGQGGRGNADIISKRNVKSAKQEEVQVSEHPGQNEEHSTIDAIRCMFQRLKSL